MDSRRGGALGIHVQVFTAQLQQFYHKPAYIKEVEYVTQHSNILLLDSCAKYILIKVQTISSTIVVTSFAKSVLRRSSIFSTVLCVLEISVETVTGFHCVRKEAIQRKSTSKMNICRTDWRLKNCDPPISVKTPEIWAIQHLTWFIFEDTAGSCRARCASWMYQMSQDRCI